MHRPLRGGGRVGDEAVGGAVGEGTQAAGVAGGVCDGVDQLHVLHNVNTDPILAHDHQSLGGR